MKKESDTRRRFFKKAAGAAAGLAGLAAFGTSCSATGKTAPKTKPVSRPGKPMVVVARDPGIWRGDSLDGGKVRKLLFRAVRKFTGASEDDKAWYALFDSDDRVGIKLNLIAGRILSSTPELTDAVIEGLLLADVKAENIIAFERTERELRRAGFTPGRAPSGALFAGTDSPDIGYDDRLTIAGEVGSLVCRTASQFSTALVNVPVLKDHDLAGFSGAMKNYFGAIHNPNKLHENGCDPYVADLNTMPCFRDKTRLIVVDGSTAQFHAGPSYKPEYAWRFSGFIVGNDPVAVDTVGWNIIEKKRREKGYKTLEQEGRPPNYIASAAARGLGENRLEKINLLEI